MATKLKNHNYEQSIISQFEDALVTHHPLDDINSLIIATINSIRKEIQGIVFNKEEIILFDRIKSQQINNGHQ